jgi:hypothetical protein
METQSGVVAIPGIIDDLTRNRIDYRYSAIKPTSVSE